MDAEDANSVLYSVSNSSPVLLHALVITYLHVHTEIGYCSVVYLITVPYLEHYITELDCTMCFIDHDIQTCPEQCMSEYRHGVITNHCYHDLGR